MKTIPSILLVVLFGVSCTSDRVTVSERIVRTSSASGRALSWLAKQQRPDGHWGTDRCEVALTSLAVLAFLSHGETPASREYGRPVEAALRTLLRDAESRTNLVPADRALMTWCLAEAYDLTGIPMLLEPAKKLAGSLDVASATPWHAFAARALCLSNADPDIGKQMLVHLEVALAARTNSIVDQATHLLLMMWTGNRKKSEPYLEHLRRQDLGQWRQSDTPILASFVLSTALFHVGGEDWAGWNRSFHPDLVRRQIMMRTLGWWTADSLGVPRTQEISRLNPEEAEVYVTSIILMTLQQRRILPSYKPPAKEDRQKTEGNETIEIKITR